MAKIVKPDSILHCHLMVHKIMPKVIVLLYLMHNNINREKSSQGEQH